MMRFPARLLAALSAFLLLAIASARALDTPYMVVDVDSGAVLAARNPHQLWYPASITKLMTAYVTFKALRDGTLKPDTEVIVSAHALGEPPSKMGFRAGTRIAIDDALKMMIVRSANDIAMAIAETVGGSEEGFVAMMNREAARLGMSSTRYHNPNGLPDPGQITTARDLAVLARALWTDFPERRDLFSIPAIRAGKRVLRSQNALLERYRGTNGMKTGFICASGFNIVATARRDGHMLMAVVLGAPSAADRSEMAARLLNKGFGSLALPGSRPSLAGFRGASPQPTPVDLRDAICRKAPQSDEGPDDLLVEEGPKGGSALEPRFVLRDPVTVTTLGTIQTAATPTVAGGAGGSTATPRPRPRPTAAGREIVIGQPFDSEALGDAGGDAPLAIAPLQ
ncbi:D-alanyl-D-alanine carboxypeptidase [Prosthecomicrobium pneumaticum]|uniref:D-alanyl-D-alanine carboxypeptidase n=2 Tax=Prosthecomicrobium pneumaticum TaxID=81895 RepID=A0A7W9FL52_9HYPH|nr:D-alanyl-D-alanine carboxypeptidase [Prosthecomicrobium pneumaticum]